MSRPSRLLPVLLSELILILPFLSLATVIGVIELLAETMTLAEQSGVGQDKLYELIKGTLRSLLLPSRVVVEPSRPDSLRFDLDAKQTSTLLLPSSPTERRCSRTTTTDRTDSLSLEVSRFVFESSSSRLLRSLLLQLDLTRSLLPPLSFSQDAAHIRKLAEGWLSSRSCSKASSFD